MARTLKHDAEVNRCARCGHPYLTHVPELRPGYRACSASWCTCEDLVKPEPAPRMPLGRPGSAGLLSDPPGGESTRLHSPAAPCGCKDTCYHEQHPDEPPQRACQRAAEFAERHSKRAEFAEWATREPTPTEAIRAAQERHAGETRSHLLARPRRPGYLDLQAELDRYREVLTEAMGATEFMSHAELRAYAADAIRYVRPGATPTETMEDRTEGEL